MKTPEQLEAALARMHSEAQKSSFYSKRSSSAKAFKEGPNEDLIGTVNSRGDIRMDKDLHFLLTADETMVVSYNLNPRGFGLPFVELVPLLKKAGIKVQLSSGRSEMRLICVKGGLATSLAKLQILLASKFKELRPPCPRCGKGYLKIRNGRFGEFLGCTAFSLYGCKYTSDVPATLRDKLDKSKY